jgi:hypothetical protein
MCRGLERTTSVLGRSHQGAHNGSGNCHPGDRHRSCSVRELAELQDYQEAVGGWIEAVDVRDLGVTVYVNEEGLLHHLRFNSRATFLWWYYVPATRNGAMLVGEAVVVGLPDRDGNSTDVPLEALLLRDFSAFAWVGVAAVGLAVFGAVTFQSPAALSGTTSRRLFAGLEALTGAFAGVFTGGFAGANDCVWSRKSYPTCRYLTWLA